MVGDLVYDSLEALEANFGVGLSPQAFLSSSAQPWQYLEVPFEIRDFKAGTREYYGILSGMERWEIDSPIRFVKATSSHRNRVIFRKSNISNRNIACNASGYGMASTRTIKLLSSCAEDSTTVAHEIGHILGLLHQHQRSDRNTYVTYNRDNTDPAMSFAFDIIPGVRQGSYDQASLMHYDSKAGSINGRSTLVAKNGKTLGDGGIRNGDVDAVNVRHHARFPCASGSVTRGCKWRTYYIQAGRNSDILTFTFTKGRKLSVWTIANDYQMNQRPRHRVKLYKRTCSSCGFKEVKTSASVYGRAYAGFTGTYLSAGDYYLKFEALSGFGNVDVFTSYD